MARTTEEIANALRLQALGCSATEIHRLMGIPRRTLSDWLRGCLPELWTRAASCSSCGGRAHEFDRLPESYAYLLGVYLGDGSIAAHPRGVYKLRIALDAAYPRIIEESAVAMAAVLSEGRVLRLLCPSNYVEVYAYSKGWPCLFPQHGPGKKHLRPIALAPWQEEIVRDAPHLLLRGLIHSDGCRFGRVWACQIGSVWPSRSAFLIR